MDGLNKAIKLHGGLTSLAAALGLSKGVVFQWRARGNVPAEYCPEIEKLTGVTCESLNSKVDWSFVRRRKTKPNTTKQEPA